MPDGPAACKPARSRTKPCDRCRRKVSLRAIHARARAWRDADALRRGGSPRRPCPLRAPQSRRGRRRGATCASALKDQGPSARSCPCRCPGPCRRLPGRKTWRRSLLAALSPPTRRRFPRSGPRKSRHSYLIAPLRTLRDQARIRPRVVPKWREPKWREQTPALCLRGGAVRSTCIASMRPHSIACTRSRPFRARLSRGSTSRQISSRPS